MNLSSFKNVGLYISRKALAGKPTKSSQRMLKIYAPDSSVILCPVKASTSVQINLPKLFVKIFKMQFKELFIVEKPLDSVSKRRPYVYVNRYKLGRKIKQHIKLKLCFL
jgi:hypothetical protein